MNDPSTPSKTLLLGFINRGKSIADQISDLQADLTDICKEAKGAGFEPTRIREVIRWLKKIDRYGRDKVDEAEAIFDLYRSVTDAKGGKLSDSLDDERSKDLLARFAPDVDEASERRLTDRRRRMRQSLALGAAAAAARGAG